jgi:hypothetical protein
MSLSEFLSGFVAHLHLISRIMNIYALKMAAVFMISTSTVAIRTRIFPRWMAALGFVLAVFLLLSVGYSLWASIVFPLWVLLISVYVLLANLSPGADPVRGAGDP